MAEWFTSFAQQALKIADDIADSIVNQANEAQTQLQNEQLKLVEEKRKREETLHSHQLLPWETNIESRQILSDSLMEKILSLAINERNFTEKPPNTDEVDFNFSDFIPVAMRLLELDHNLARMHAKLSPKMNEEIFWFNYFCRVSYLRSVSGIDGPLAQKESEKWEFSQIICESKVAEPVKVTSIPSPVQTIEKTPSRKADSLTEDSNNHEKSVDSVNGFDDLDLDMQDIKDIELDELADINPDDFEEIGSSEGMDELEAQIARELEEERIKQKR